MADIMILVVGMAIVLLYILSSSTTGERLKTLLLRLEQAGLSVTDFIPEGEWGYRGVIRIKLPAKRDNLNLGEFISMAEKHNQDTIYRKRSPSPWGVLVHYVFNRDKTAVWTYYAW